MVEYCENCAELKKRIRDQIEVEKLLIAALRVLTQEECEKPQFGEEQGCKSLKTGTEKLASGLQKG